MGQQTLSYARRERLQPDPLVLASYILLHIGFFVTLLVGLFPLFLDPVPDTFRYLILCTWGAGTLAAEWIAIFARSRFATVLVIASLAIAAYITFEAAMREGIRNGSGRFLLVPFALLLIAVAGQARWIRQISRWRRS